MTWNAFDEGYLSAYRWSGSLAGGVALPVESTATPLEPGEVAHAEIAQAGAVDLVAGLGGGPAVQLQPAALQPEGLLERAKAEGRLD